MAKENDGSLSKPEALVTVCSQQAVALRKGQRALLDVVFAHELAATRPDRLHWHANALALGTSARLKTWVS